VITFNAPEDEIGRCLDSYGWEAGLLQPVPLRMTAAVEDL
jgi:hypothetical protein